MAEVKEKVNAGVKPSSIEIVADGVIVRFAYHQPRKIFVDPFELYKFVNEFKKNPEKKTFKSENINCLMLRGNRVKITLKQPVSGHKELTIPKDGFIKEVVGCFEPIE